MNKFNKNNKTLLYAESRKIQEKGYRIYVSQSSSCHVIIGKRCTGCLSAGQSGCPQICFSEMAVPDSEDCGCFLSVSVFKMQISCYRHAASMLSVFSGAERFFTGQDQHRVCSYCRPWRNPSVNKAKIYVDYHIFGCDYFIYFCHKAGISVLENEENIFYRGRRQRD